MKIGDRVVINDKYLTSYGQLGTVVRRSPLGEKAPEYFVLIDGENAGDEKVFLIHELKKVNP